MIQRDIVSKLHELKPLLTQRFYVSRIGYFGSYASGTPTDASDIDLLVEFSKPVGWNFFTLEEFLEKSLGIKVDLVTSNALKERIKSSVLNQVKFI